MTDGSEKQKIQTGILTILANRIIGTTYDEMPFVDSRYWSIENIVTRLKQRRIEVGLLDRNRWRSTYTPKVDNPFQCKDEELIRAVVRDMVDAGLLESKGRGSHSPNYFMTKKGAEAIGDIALVEAFRTGITGGDVRATLSPAGSREPGNIAMSRVEAVLGKVVGRDSPITQQILRLLREERGRGK